MTPNLQAQKALTSGELVDFMPRSERLVLLGNLLREEHEFFTEQVLDLVKRVESMPSTGMTDGQGDDAIVYLHYFKGSVDAWITERDVGDGSGDTAQHQAFGKVDLGYGAEWGYVSIQELIDNGVELDLYWTPKPMKECK